MRRVRPILQAEATECGAACLAMLLNYHGRPTGLSEVRERCEVGRDGLTGSTIARVARGYGMRVQAFSLSPADLRGVSLPAIVHWESRHFLVLERVRRDRFELVDPAWGRRVLSATEFGRGFTGAVVTATPHAEFSRDGTGYSRWASLAPILRTLWAPAAVVQILLASVLLQGFGLACPLLTGFLIDRIIAAQMQPLMNIVAVGIGLLGAGYALTMLLRSFLLIALHSRLDIRLTVGLLSKLVELPYRFFQQRSNGDLFEKLACTTAIRDALGQQLLGRSWMACS